MDKGRHALYVWGLLVLLSLGSVLNSFGQAIPAYQGFVNDYVGLLRPDQRSQLEQYLTQFAQSTSNEIAIIIMNLPDEATSIEDYTIDLAREWGVGGAENDNGVIIAVYNNVRKVRIEVGYGLEGAIPDIVAYNIIEKDLKPAFRSGDYYGGLFQAVQVLSSAARAEINDANTQRYYNQTTASEGDGGGLPIGLIIFLIILLISITRNRNGGGGYGGGGWYWGPVFWGGGFRGGGGSDWTGGGGGFGGGGFGGFGGGDFGGGGASGGW